MPNLPKPRKRADLSAGACYAINDGKGRFFFAQIACDQTSGFSRCRSETPNSIELALDAPVLCRMAVGHRSIGPALREGVWLYLGRHALREELRRPHKHIAWPVGDTQVEVIEVTPDGSWENTPSRIDDPAIQNLEVAITWDALDIAERLEADVAPEKAAWHIGGPVWRQRRVALEYALRFPDNPFHVLRGQNALLATEPTPDRWPSGP